MGLRPARGVAWNLDLRVFSAQTPMPYLPGRPRRLPAFTDSNQWRGYHSCAAANAKRHAWLGFLDADEFVVFQPGGLARGGAHNLPLLLARLEAQGAGALALNWVRSAAAGACGGKTPVCGLRRSRMVGRHLYGVADGGKCCAQTPAALPHVGPSHHPPIQVLFGSSGHKVRPRGGPLASYTACVPASDPESTHTKVIAHTAELVDMGPTPHQVVLKGGARLVDADGAPTVAPKSDVSRVGRVALYHYVLKSRAEFANKMARGSGAGNIKTFEYW